MWKETSPWGVRDKPDSMYTVTQRQLNVIVCLKAGKDMWTIWHRHTWHSSQIGVKRPSLWFIKEETKARCRKKIKVLNKTSFSYQIEVLFSFWKTFKILVSSKKSYIQNHLLKQKESLIKEPSVFLLLLFLGLFDWFPLSLSLFLHFFSGKMKRLREKKRKCQAVTKKCGLFLHKCRWHILN